MFHKVKKIKPLDNYMLEAEFINGLKKIYDVKPLFKRWPVFKDLKNIPGLFKQVRVDCGGYGIAWNDKIDLACDELWVNGRAATGDKKSEMCNFVYAFVKSRKAAKITQQELEKRTGIKQTVIARFENGGTDTRLSTITALASAIGFTLTLQKP